MSISTRTAEEAREAGLGIAVMCAGIFCLVVNDAFAKRLTEDYAALEIMFMRALIATPMVAAAALAFGGRRALATRHLRVHALRGLMLVGGTWCFFLGLGYLPLAEATSLVFAAPIFITALSVPLLGERVGWRRWLAVLAGFAGVLIIVRPGAAAFQPASLLPVGTALFYALVMLSARWIGRAEGVWPTMFYVVAFPLVFSGLAVWTVWRAPEAGHLPLFLGMAVFGTLGLTLISQAFRMAPAAIVAPFDYTALVWASLFGWLVWGELPGLWTYGGAAVIILSGIYIVIRETRAGRR